MLVHDKKIKIFNWRQYFLLTHLPTGLVFFYAKLSSVESLYLESGCPASTTTLRGSFQPVTNLPLLSTFCWSTRSNCSLATFQSQMNSGFGFCYMHCYLFSPYEPSVSQSVGLYVSLSVIIS